MSKDRDTSVARPDRPQPVIKFEEVTSDEFARKATSFEVKVRRDGALLSGICPRCGDPMEFVHVQRVYRGSPRRNRESNGATVIPVMCTCEGDHAGRPKDEQGCGAYWNLLLGSGSQ